MAAHKLSNYTELVHSGFVEVTLSVRRSRSGDFQFVAVAVSTRVISPSRVTAENGC